MTVMERVNKRRQMIGFSMMQVNQLASQKPLEAELLPALS